MAGCGLVSLPSEHAVSPGPVAATAVRLPLRRLRTGDTLRTFANGRIAQHPVDPLVLELVFRV